MRFVLAGQDAVAQREIHAYEPLEPAGGGDHGAEMLAAQTGIAFVRTFHADEHGAFAVDLDLALSTLT